MTTTQIEKRLSTLELEMAELRSKLSRSPSNANDWVEKIAATFSDPKARAAFDQATRYGRQWRNKQRPDSRKRSGAARG